MQLFKTLTLFAAGLSLAASVNAAPVTPSKSFRFTPDNYCGKPGVTAKTTLKFEANPGFMLEGYDIKILRKDAPKEFFAIPNLPISKHRASAYDSFVVAPYKRLPQAQSSGQQEIAFDLRGYLEGDYSVIVVGCFVDQAKKRYYAGGTFYLTITESDKSVLPGNVKPAVKNVLKVETPAPNAAQVFDGNFEFAPDQKVRLYSMFVLRKGAPAEFFTKYAANVEKHKNSAYDRITLQKNTSIVPPGNVGTFQIKPTLALVPGKYQLIVQLYGLDADKKPFYKSVSIDYTVQ